MAYKFQLGPAVMSGSLTQEGGLIIKDDDGSQRLSVDRDSGQISGSGGMQIVGAAELGSNLAVSGTVKLDGVADATVDLANDSMYFLDSDGLMKREALSDYAVAIAGPGLGAVGGALEANVDDSSIEISSDTLQVKALGITDAMLAGSISDAKLAEDYVQVGEFTGSFNDVLATKDTDDLAEGASNLYFTDARARASVSVTDAGGDGSLAYDNSTGVITYTGPSAAEVRAHFTGGEMIDISSGDVSINNTEFSGSWDDVLATKDTDDLAEGASNLYFTDARARAAISEDADILSYDSNTGVLSVEAAAMSGSTLDIVGDASAATAVRSHFSAGEMLGLSGGEFSIDATAFSGSWADVLATKDTDDLSEGASNLYFTDARARAAISVTDAGGDGSLAYDNSTGVITYTGPSAAEVRAHFSAGEMISISSGEIAIDAAVFSASADVRWDAKMAAADTGDLAEGSNLYYTDARVHAALSMEAARFITYDGSGNFAMDEALFSGSARGLVSVTDSGGDGSLSYDNSTGVFTYTGPSAAEVRAHFTAGDGLAV
jgi:hypothetical protein